jgi:lipoyl(octanoyl) transferase
MHHSHPIEWRISAGLTPFAEALAAMEARVEAVADGREQELLWLLEHPPLYTGGTSAKAEHLLTHQFPVYETGRGGQYTYHGPGQRVVYTVLNVKARAAPAVPDVRRFVHTLEQWIIDTLLTFGVVGERREGRIGIWVRTPVGEAKIAALGIRIRRGVSLHGIAINLCPDLSHFGGIIPCGIQEYGVTSLHALGHTVSMADMDAALRHHCPF